MAVRKAIDEEKKRDTAHKLKLKLARDEKKANAVRELRYKNKMRH